ncbi:uncharacterized protein C9orf57 homolog [Callithrix jacchus]|uniref:uncharacterized protein C9orf57 homolog n=1 Tax=Callithrix jacchus TaxID=9483 RepID=UPI0023DD5C05|nr:uncharacterized protein C9orf57 homolog [Callithrix jacchus]
MLQAKETEQERPVREEKQPVAFSKNGNTLLGQGSCRLDQSVGFSCNRLHRIRNCTYFHPFKEAQTQENFHSTVLNKEKFNSGTCLSFHFLFGLEIRMRRIVFAGGVILFCLLGDAGGMMCRACNLSLPFHRCILDLGTCKSKPGQYCIKEVHIKGGIEWYSIKGCTKNISECFKRIMSPYEIRATHCCHHLCAICESVAHI